MPHASIGVSNRQKCANSKGRLYWVGTPIYARKMAAMAAKPATAMELRNELAEPSKGMIGELVGAGPATLSYVSRGMIARTLCE